MLLIAGHGICARIPLSITAIQQCLLIMEISSHLGEFLEASITFQPSKIP